MRTVRFIVTLLAAGLLAGCEGARQSQISRSLMEAGEYEKAVAHAQAALEKEPGKAEYLDLLSDAQTAAAEQHYTHARALADGHRPAAAMAEVGKALEYMPAHPDSITLQTKLRGDLEALRARLSAAGEAMAREDWAVGLKAAEQAQAIDADDNQARQIADRARSALLSQHLTEAQVALQAGQPDQARAACEQARKLDADNPYVQQMVAKLGSRAPAAGATLAQATPREATPAANRPVTAPQPVASAQPPRPAAVPHPAPAPLPVTVAQRQPAQTPGSPTASRDPARRPTFLGRRPTASAPASRPASPPQQPVPAQRSAVPGRIEPASQRAFQPPPPSAPMPPPRPVARNTGPEPLFKGTISRDDRRYPKELAAIDGLVIKLKDTDADPLDCDLEIRAGGSTARLDDLAARQPVGLRGRSGRTYTLVVTHIVDATETVHFSIEPRVPMPAAPRP